AFAPDAVRALRIGLPGVIVATAAGVVVESHGSTRTYPLPRGTTVLDYAQGLVLYRQGASLRVLRLSNRRSALLRSPGSSAPAALSRRGIAYANGRAVFWAGWPAVTAPLNT